jgi:thioredoxin reductase (NADPH)
MTDPGGPTDDLVETPDPGGAFPRLTDDQIALLREGGRVRRTEAGQVLIAEGQRDRDVIVVLAGKVAVFEGYGTPEQRLVTVHGPGRLLDEIGLLTGQPAFVSSVVHEPGEVLAVAPRDLGRLVARDPALSDVILRAFICRRELLVGRVAGIRVIGSRYDPDTRRLREFAARNRLPHTWIDLETDPAAEALLQRLDVPPEQTPVVIWRGTQVLHNPSNAELARTVGLPLHSPPDARADLVVVGAGPAGLAAAVYGASEGLSTVVVDSVAAGGQAATSSRIENYLGFPAGISGAELADRAVIQAEKFGATISVPAQATALEPRDGYHAVRFDDGSDITARAVVIATGARYRRLDVPRLAEFEGTSVYYAATVMEARFCRSQPVVVVGGGHTPGQATLYLARYASRIQLLIRHDDLGRDMSRYLVDQIEREPGVEVLRNTEVCELDGREGELEALVVMDNRTGRTRRLAARLLFVFIGAQPCTGWLRGSLDLDDGGYVRTGAQVAGEAAESGRLGQLLETSRPGVLAAGDVRAGSIKRVASAAGEGSMAIRLVHEHLLRSGHTPGR